MDVYDVTILNVGRDIACNRDPSMETRGEPKSKGTRMLTPAGVDFVTAEVVVSRGRDRAESHMELHVDTHLIDREVVAVLPTKVV